MSLKWMIMGNKTPVAVLLILAASGNKRDMAATTAILREFNRRKGSLTRDNTTLISVLFENASTSEEIRDAFKAIYTLFRETQNPLYMVEVDQYEHLLQTIIDEYVEDAGQ